MTINYYPQNNVADKHNIMDLIYKTTHIYILLQLKKRIMLKKHNNNILFLHPLL